MPTPTIAEALAADIRARGLAEFPPRQRGFGGALFIFSHPKNADEYIFIGPKGALRMGRNWSSSLAMMVTSDQRQKMVEHGRALLTEQAAAKRARQ
jgi:hypothetical protein